MTSQWQSRLVWINLAINSSSQDIISVSTVGYTSSPVSLSQLCTCSCIFSPIPFVLTLSVCADILFGRWLVKEPVTYNPLKLIFRILRYAIKNKYPRQRSAFTYWDDKPFTRIDLGESRYSYSGDRISILVCLIILGGASHNNSNRERYIPYKPWD